MSWKLGSLFDGSGGFPLAGLLCDVDPRWASEVEPYPIAVTRSRFPKMKHLGDISKINGAELEPVDIITFGSPCQDLSVAGKRAGLKHEANGDEETTRSGLFMEAVRIIKEMKEATNGEYPRFALWENVPGAFSSNKGEDFRVVLEELIKIVEPTATMPAVPPKGWPYADSYAGDGWSIAYRVFDAQYWGVPQRRRRIHLVLDLRGECAREVLFEREGLRGYFAQGGTAWESLATDAEGGSGANDREGEGCIAYGWPLGFRAENTRVYEETATTLCNGTRPGFTCGVVEVMPTLCSDSHSTPHAVAYSVENHPADSRVSIDESGKVQTLTGRMGTGGGNVPMVMAPVPFCKGSRPKFADDVTTWKDGKVANTLNTFDLGEVRCNELVVVPIHDQATRFSGKRGDKSDGKGNGLVVGNPGDPMNTLTSGDRHAVAYWDGGQIAGTLTANNANGAQRMPDKENFNCVIAIDRAFFNQGQNALYDPQLYEDGTNPTLVARGPNAVAVRYIVRRLTPTECARLQGFADQWGEIEEKEDFTEEEYRFWLDVRNTHAEINGKVVKDYTKKQMLTWYNKLHTDSAEYKMWGNGIALPPALYCMQGIVDVLKREH